ncbi:MAG: hypothetical protein WD449_02140, partial [Candidatus Babeliales bacterium]
MKKYLSLLLNSMLLAHGGLLSAQDESKESFTANLRKKVTRVFNYQTIKRSIMAPAMLKAVGVALVGIFVAAGGRRWTRRNSARNDGSAVASMNIKEKELPKVEPWEEDLPVKNIDPLSPRGPLDMEVLQKTLDNAHNQAKAEFDKVKKTRPYSPSTLENTEDQETAELAALVENIKPKNELGVEWLY